MSECLFCQIAAGEIPCHKIFENDLLISFLDIRPLNPGHTLLIPKRHSEHLLEANDAEVKVIFEITKKIAPAILQSVGAVGCNVTTNIGRAAGQAVFHTHVHIIPRYNDDGYIPWERKDGISDGFSAVAERIRDVLKNDGCLENECFVKISGTES
ncbi:MAG: HIT family protein [Candidatus Uhrbacteria bacterium]